MKRTKESILIFDRRIFVFTFFSTSIFYLLQILSNWWLLSITGIKGQDRFGDLKLVLMYFDCYNTVGQDVFTAPTDDPCTGYIYGRQFLYLMSRLGIGEDSVNILAALLILSFLIISSAIIALAPSMKKSTVLGLLVIISPGCWLLLERTNLDILIFVFIGLAVFSIDRKFPGIAVLLLVISAFIKFYTFPLAIITIFFIQKLQQKILAAVFVSLSGTLLMSEIVRIPRLPSSWYVSFGNQIIAHWWNLLLSVKKLDWPEADFLLGSIVGGIFILICSIICSQLFRQSIKSFSVDLEHRLVKLELMALVYLYTASVFLICYFAGMNYDYRLFYEGISCLIAVKLLPKNSALLRFLVLTTLISLWCSSFFYGMEGIRVIFIQLIGDVFTGISASINALIILNLLLLRIRHKTTKHRTVVE